MWGQFVQFHKKPIQKPVTVSADKNKKSNSDGGLFTSNKEKPKHK